MSTLQTTILKHPDSASNNIQFDSSSRVGIGKSPSAKLDVNGNVQFGDGGGFDMNINGTRHQFSIGGSEKMRISSAGHVGIGLVPSSSDSLPNISAGILQTNHNIDIRYSGSNSDPAGARYLNIVNNDSTLVQGQPLGGINWVGNDSNNPAHEMASIRAICAGNAGTTGHIVFRNNQEEKLRLDNEGRLLLGTTSSIGGEFSITDGSGAQISLARDDSGSTVSGNSLGQIRFYGNHGGTYSDIGRIICSADADHTSTSKPANLRFFTNNGTTTAERVKIDNNGDLLLSFNGNTYEAVTIDHTETYGNGTMRIQPVTIPGSGTSNFATHFASKGSGGVTQHNVVIDGALSKGSGSFRIPHPVKPETHQLVHSFVEGPQADNIYRGKVDLVAGTASVNIDTVVGMTEGTFVALNREVQCFTTNETGWTAIKGSVTGNLLTITAQENTCTDTISWLVIGERQDQHMYNTNWTDENGKVILEPENPTKETE